MRRIVPLLITFVLAALPLTAQTRSAPVPAILGTWKLDPQSTSSQRKTAPATVIVRDDSSASYGKETVRWRLPKKDVIALALGGEWVTYKYKVRGQRMTLSGGDLTEPVTLTRVGPPSVRPDSVHIPPDPDLEPS
jgi:hypothetical protein